MCNRLPELMKNGMRGYFLFTAALNIANSTIPATHTRKPIRSKYCSVITQDADTKNVTVFVSNKYIIIPAAHDSFVFSVGHNLKKIR